jgi:mannosyltransferase OCH1-like enzyme
MIPFRLHQIWFQGADQIPMKYHPFQQSWRHHHPHWDYRLWDQPQIEQLVATCSNFVQSLYHQLPERIQKIDLAKYLILQRYGGVYVDMDMECVQPLDSLFQKHPHHDLYLAEIEIGCVSNRLCLAIMVLSAGELTQGPYYNNAFFAIVPNHPIWDLVIMDIAAHVKSNRHHDFYIQDSAGPMMLTRVVRMNPEFTFKFFSCPPSYFEPCDKFAHGTCNLQEAYAIHYYGNSWVSPLMKILAAAYTQSSRAIALILLVGLIIGMLIGWIVH